MGLYITCPYFVAEKNKSITCEGCIRCFGSTTVKQKQIRMCEDGGKGCSYAARLTKTYERYEDSPMLEAKLLRCYLSEANSQINGMLTRTGKLEHVIGRTKKNCAHAMEVRQRDVERAQSAYKLASNKAVVLEQSLYAVMYKKEIPLSYVQQELLETKNHRFELTEDGEVKIVE